MAKVLINEFAVAGKKVKRTYAIYGGLVPPFTMSIGSDKYIMPGWYKLDKDEDMPNIEDIAFYPYKPSKRPLPEGSIGKVYKVLSSKGDKDYQVNYNVTGSLECSCPGYGFRRRCRHIDYVTAELL
tara:strand:+ start:489 stop:866 length:378 start_codon:yes stop_codon:yes gene_type:complete